MTSLVSDAEFLPRQHCARCERPLTVCYCAHLRRLDTHTRVLILQHPREENKPIGTAKMASLCLPSATLLTGVSFEQHAEVRRALADPARPAVLLYPGAEAIDIEQEPPNGPVTLVVLDGTWWQSRKLLRQNPALAALPRYRFSPKRPSEYRIRREPDREYVSTIEPIAHVLGVLEPEPARFRSMLEPFRAMVDMQISHQQGRPVQRAKRPRGPKPRAISLEERQLRERWKDVVCVTVESNAWPYADGRRAYPDQLVQWVAHRPFDERTREVIVRPIQPLAPGTSRHTRLSESDLSAGVESSDALRQWREFIGHGALICSWGPYGRRMLGDAQEDDARWLDLRLICRRLGRGAGGAMSDVCARMALAVPAALGRGRGGLRAAELSAIARALALDPEPVQPPLG